MLKGIIKRLQAMEVWKEISLCLIVKEWRKKYVYYIYIYRDRKDFNQNFLFFSL